MKNVSIPEGVSQIGDQTFWGCRSLTGIDIPDSVTSIGIRAFCACKSLTSVTVPDKVTYIGDDAFVNCSGLVNVILPDSVDYYGDRVFSGCTSLVSLAIPKGATQISNEEFYDITALVSITIPDGVESVGKDAFYNCVNLTKVVLPDSIDSIGDYAFCKCSNLQTVVMPENAEYIGESAFRECSKLTRISIPDGVEEIANETFYFCDNLVSVTIPDSVACIGENAFWGCFDLTNVVLPEGIEEIGDGAFGNTGLMSIVIPDSLSYVGEKAFYSCDLVSVSIPDGITEIKDSTFYYCQDLVSIRIPASVKSIADNAFTACYDLAEIHGESGSFAETYAYEKGYRFIDETAISLDMTAAKLSKTALAPGDSVVISGIKVKNADYVHISGNNLHLKEEDIGEAAFDVLVINSKEDQTLDNITMVLSEETAVEGTFYISVQAFDDEEKSTYIDQSTLVYTVSYETVDMPALDMSDAELNKGIYNPGETVVISGIKVRNADRVHFSGNNTALTITDIEVANSSEYQMMADVELTLSEDTSFGDFYISVQAFDNEGNASDIDQSTLKYRVAAEEEKLKWKASYDKYYTTITVKVVSGAPDENTDYLFVAENAKGKHHSGTIPAGKTTASFRIKDLQMPRAAKYDLYVLPDDVALTDENRSDYFVDDVVLPLWGGNMIYNVYSGGTDVTDTKKLYKDEDIKVVWEGSYGVYNVEVAATLNGTTVFSEKYTDPVLIDRDEPVMTTIDSSCFNNAKTGNELEISVTVIPTEEAQSLLVGAEKEPTENSSWKGLIKTPVYRAIAVAMDLNDDIVQDAVDIPLWPFDNYDYTISTDAGVADYITMWGAFRESSKCEYSTINVKYAPTKNEFEFMVNSLINEGICEGDVTVIFVSAHGGRTDDLSIHGVRFSDEWMYTDELHDIIAAIPGTVVLVLNCCYSGAIIDEFSDSETNVAIITACSKSETAGFYAGEYSLMPHYLGIGAGYDYNIGVTGLLADQDGDDAVSIQEWFDFASANVSATMQEDGGIQTMKICASNKLRELVLFAR